MSHPGGPRRRTKSQLGTLVQLGDAVSRRRFQLELTQAEVADLAGVGVASVRALEAGQATLSLELAIRILAALGLTLGVADVRALRANPDIAIVAHGTT